MAGVPGPLHTSLQAAATFLLEVQDASCVRGLLEAADIRARAVQLLTAQCQALEALLPQVQSHSRSARMVVGAWTPAC